MLLQSSPTLSLACTSNLLPFNAKLTLFTYLTTPLFQRYDLKYYALACVALLYYDWILTLPLEIRRVWASKFTFGTYLFFINRYVSVIAYIPIVLSLFNPPWDIQVCSNPPVLPRKILTPYI